MTEGQGPPDPLSHPSSGSLLVSPEDQVPASLTALTEMSREVFLRLDSPPAVHSLGLESIQLLGTLQTGPCLLKEIELNGQIEANRHALLVCNRISE